MTPKRWIIAGGVAGLLLLVIVGPGLLHRGHAWRKDQRLTRYAPLIDKYARTHRINSDFLAAVIWAESGGDPSAQSNQNAKGLMQITPVTEKDVHQRHPEIGPGDLTDPDYNLRIGSTYLAYLLSRFDQDRKLALAAYHMGPTRVRKKQQASPAMSTDQLIAHHAGPQTRAYVKRVMARFHGG